MTTTQPTPGQEPRVPAVVQQFRIDLSKMESQFKMALPAHIPVERFMRVILTAVQNAPKLLACDRQSLFNAAVRAAADGLLPDGREGAIVPFGDDDDEGTRKRGDSSKATWMPMIAGLRKVARNSGEINTWDVHLVYQGDQFEYELGDDPFIRHKPAPAGGLHRKITHAYSVAKLKDGGISRDVMNIDEIEDIRKAFSRAKKGPWSNPSTYGEMCKKTVARRHSKVLPKSTDLDRVLHRDDDLYDFTRARQDAEPVTAQRPANIAAAFDHFGAGLEPGNTIESNGKQLLKPEGEGEPPGATTRPEKSDDANKGASDAGSDRTRAPGAQASGGTEQQADGPPRDAESYKRFVRKVIDDVKDGEDALKLEAFFASEAQRQMRNKCGVTKADYDVVQGWVREALDKHKSAKK
ncbi:MAG TPA: recombinase RecT [Candidatus Eremiobacteraceae bacterium]|nr:recombinase RecT [Candidatus Eremiobacteraceae bacterium]